MPNSPRQRVPLAYVADVRASASFYEKLGFDVGNSHADPGSGEIAWAALERGNASLMPSKANGPVDAGQQAILFYSDPRTPTATS